MRDLGVNWKLEQPQRLSVEHYDKATGRWTILHVDFPVVLDTERKRRWRTDELMRVYWRGGKQALVEWVSGMRGVMMTEQGREARG